MVTVKGWYEGGGRGELSFDTWGDECSVNAGDRSRVLCRLVLKILTEGSLTTEASNLFQNITTLTEKGDPVVQPCRGALLGYVECEGEKPNSDPHSNDP